LSKQWVKEIEEAFEGEYNKKRRGPSARIKRGISIFLREDVARAERRCKEEPRRGKKRN